MPKCHTLMDLLVLHHMIPRYLPLAVCCTGICVPCMPAAKASFAHRAGYKIVFYKHSQGFLHV